MIPIIFLNTPGPNYVARDASSTIFNAGNPFRSASTAFAAAASLGCCASDFEVKASSSMDKITASPVSTACCPPRNYTRVVNYSRQLTAPTAALPSTKSRRRRRKSGGGNGGDDDPSWNGDGGGGGGWDGGDGSGGDGQGGGGGDEFSKRYWMHDIMLVWAIFCTWSTWSVVYMAAREKLSSPCLATISASQGYMMPSDFTPNLGEASV